MRVTLAKEYKTQGGRNYKADSTVNLPTDEARNLLHLGLARAAEEAEAKPKPENTEKEA